ncbi:thiosulfate oxidation carrier protein SoxY [Methylogaea oryzae]|uniref:Thiosulfate oxidation carrier protein SoxY n=2 Tax=Methylogaea oryzae TaxID=1295382 RepID=A0A8D4VLC5_9GAMM|nr:thiosulfate oxidation carrier protein SoxY [Methylogaea oryzae]BBL69652.1 thiosulfate oxidation carrier protein SoxY [Methylogaea oryzae]
MSLSRRKFIGSLLAGGVAALASHIVQAAGAYMHRPWPRHAFAAKQLAETQTQLFGHDKPTESAQIVLDIPDVAEDGAAVPVSVSTTLTGTESITLLAEKNPTPLLAEFLIGERLEPFVSTRVKLAATGVVIAVVRAEGRLYSTRKTVKVTVGGCG